jgi:hypothetical protein
LEFDVTPPGAWTTTEAVPAEAIRVAGTAAVNCTGETKVVTSAAPFHCTVAPLTKLVPFTANVNAGPPANALLGEMEVTAGAGTLMAKPIEFDVVASGACTNTEAVPEVVIKLADTAAVTRVAETKVVTSAEPFH